MEWIVLAVLFDCNDDSDHENDAKCCSGHGKWRLSQWNVRRWLRKFGQPGPVPAHGLCDGNQRALLHALLEAQHRLPTQGVSGHRPTRRKHLSVSRHSVEELQSFFPGSYKENILDEYPEKLRNTCRMYKAVFSLVSNKIHFVIVCMHF